MVRRSLRSWLWRIPVEQEVDEELAFHLEMRTRQLIARGLTPRAARAEALERLGNLRHLKRTCIDIGRKRDRNMRFTQWIEEFVGDFRFGCRHLRNAPGFALVAVVTLSLGIGATTAIFSVVHAVVLRPLPLADPDRAVIVGEDWEGRPSDVSVGNFHDWRRHARSFTSLAAEQPFSFNLAEGELPERVNGSRVTSTWFSTLGFEPLHGRGFTSDDDTPGRDRVVILSHRLWTRRFASNPAIAGREIRLNGVGHTVIGVMPAAADITATWEELWTPIAFTPTQLAEHDEHYLNVVGRLAPGVTLDQANAELRTLYARVQADHPTDQQINQGVAAPYQQQLVGDYRRRLLVLLGAVALILLIACSNVANLVLARGAVRAREMALRLAIGAGRGRMVRQLLTETLVLTLTGTVGGVALAWIAVPALISSAPPGVPRLEQAHVNVTVLLFALAISLFAAFTAGLVPALRAVRADLRGALHDGGRSGAGGLDRLRALLVSTEVGLTLMLLVGAGLLVRSALYLERVDPGFDPRGVITARVTLPALRYEDRERIVASFEDLVETLATAPAVEAAAVSSQPPLTPGGNGNGLIPAGKPYDERSAVNARLQIVTVDYFRTLKIPLRRGRPFGSEDRFGAPLVMILNETAARALFPGEDPIGQRVACCEGSPTDPRWKTVVGVVADVRSRGPARDVFPEFFLPIAQAPDVAWTWIQRTMAIVARSRTGDASSLISITRDATRRIDPTLPLYQIRSMEERLQASVAQARFNTVLMLLLAGLGLILSAIGVYGVIAYVVTQRQHEIGIRMALGARSSAVVRLILFQGLKPVVSGIVIGVAGALAASRALSTYVYGVTTTDPLTFAVVVLVLVVVAIAATALPARRAVKVDPRRALTEG